MPFAAFAAVTDISSFLTALRDIINQLIPFVIAIAGLIFIIGVVKFVTAAGDEEKRREGRNFILYGIIGLAVIFVFWGLVNVLINTFGFDVGLPSIPTVPTIP